MGVFDSVYVQCSKCGRTVEFQSKAGKCAMEVYNQIMDIPNDVAVDLNGESVKCICGNEITFNSEISCWITEQYVGK